MPLHILPFAIKRSVCKFIRDVYVSKRHDLSVQSHVLGRVTHTFQRHLSKIGACFIVIYGLFLL